MISPHNLSQKIDHTNLRADATERDIKILCDEAILYKFKSVCVNPANIETAADILKESEIGICAVIGFPLGASTSESKAFEAEQAILNGASELDMVLNMGFLKSGKYELVQKDIQAVRDVACGKIVKVILETAILTREEKIKACLLAEDAGADYVKTSTGFGGLKGATVEDVELLRKTVGKKLGVKASGGIRDLKTALTMIDAGADRIGTSSGVKIMEELKLDENEELNQIR